MEAAQYLWSLLTDQYQNFTKWALFGHTLQDSDRRGHPTSICAYHYKMVAAQYLWSLLTDQYQNFTKWAHFGHTLQDSDRRGHPTSICAYHYKMEAAPGPPLWLLTLQKYESLAIRNTQSNTTKQNQCISMPSSMRFWDKLCHLEKWLFLPKKTVSRSESWLW